MKARRANVKLCVVAVTQINHCSMKLERRIVRAIGQSDVYGLSVIREANINYGVRYFTFDMSRF